MTPITIATDTAGKPITVGKDPDGIAITPDGKTVYVANIDLEHGDTDLDGHQHRGKPIRIGEPRGDRHHTGREDRLRPRPSWGSGHGQYRSTRPPTLGKADQGRKLSGAMAMTPDGRTLYVANSASNTVTPITTATNRPETRSRSAADPLDRDHAGRQDRLRRRPGRQP